jgi:1,4-alpha-glucan branching enzyme
LLPGEFHVYVSRNINNVMATPVINVPWDETSLEARVYPNPLAPSSMVEIKLPQAGNVTVDLYNASGQFVKTVSNKFLVKGTHQIGMKEPGLSRGIYYLKLRTRQAIKTISVTVQ